MKEEVGRKDWQPEWLFPIPA